MRERKERSEYSGLKYSDGDEGSTLLSTFIDVVPNPNSGGVRAIIKPECFIIDITYKVIINGIHREFKLRKDLDEFLNTCIYYGNENINITVEGHESNLIWNMDMADKYFADCVNPEVKEIDWLWFHTYTLKNDRQFIHFWRHWVDYRDQVCYY